MDSDDDEERLQEAMASAAELNPYANIRLERKYSAAFRDASSFFLVRRKRIATGPFY